MEVSGTLIDKSPANERNNSRTHSAGIGCLLSLVKILIQERVLSLYMRLMIQHNNHLAVVVGDDPLTREVQANPSPTF